MSGLTSKLSSHPAFRHGTAACLLLALFALLVFSVTMKSPTADEQNHIARGLAYLRTGDLRLSQEHPPGVNVWEAWPLLLDPDVRLPLDSPSWANSEWYGFADQLLWKVNDHPQTVVFATRVPVMWLTVMLGALVYRWARELGGGWAGLIALGLTVFDPNVLAHGRLTTNDMGVTCATVVAMYALWRALREPGWKRWILAGVFLGAAQLTKFSALVLGPLTLLLTALTWGRQWVSDRSFPARATGLWALRLLVLFGVGLAIIWAGYRFTWGSISGLDGIPVPAPAYWAGIQTILKRTGGGNPAFLIGQYSQTGWWYYFPVAFAIKTPLPTLVFLTTAVGMWGREEIGRLGNWEITNRKLQTTKPFGNHQTLRKPPNLSLCLILPTLAFWAMAIVGSFNIGYRHILPSLPFLYILVGWQIGRSQIANRKFTSLGAGLQVCRFPYLPFALCSLLILWLAVGTASIAPHYLAFFNQVAGGPDGGYRYLVDSNLDWGQDLPGLKRYVEAHGIERINLSWFGAAHPEAYDFPFHPLPGFWRFGGEPAAYGLNPYTPAPGTYAISASNLQGIKLADRDLYAWFREQTPVARIGHSILIYQVQDKIVGDQAVVLGVPMAQLADEERALLRRVPSIRQYDPTTGSIVPNVIPFKTVWLITPQPIDGAQEIRSGPGYVVSRRPGWKTYSPVALPSVSFGEFATMWGYYVEKQVSLEQVTRLTLHVQWVVDAPHRAAVSFAHLLDAEGRYVAGWDGLAAPATCWQRGDNLWQRYEIPLPADLPPGTYRIQVGWYDAETGERWPCYVNGEEIGDRFLLPDVEIRL